ncbi:MAG TPA: hypothetical protein PKK94_27465, partial [Leptospiraceae bacterium]|nr:hypothetical protein [Leptospiraceae bacterium]
MSTEKKKSSPGRETNELKLGNLQDMLQVFGLIESAGKYFNPSVSGKVSEAVPGLCRIPSDKRPYLSVQFLRLRF